MRLLRAAHLTVRFSLLLSLSSNRLIHSGAASSQLLPAALVGRRSLMQPVSLHAREFSPSPPTVSDSGRGALGMAGEVSSRVRCCVDYGLCCRPKRALATGFR